MNQLDMLNIIRIIDQNFDHLFGTEYCLRFLLFATGKKNQPTTKEW